MPIHLTEKEYETLLDKQIAHLKAHPHDIEYQWENPSNFFEDIDELDDSALPCYLFSILTPNGGPLDQDSKSNSFDVKAVRGCITQIRARELKASHDELTKLVMKYPKAFPDNVLDVTLNHLESFKDIQLQAPRFYLKKGLR